MSLNNGCYHDVDLTSFLQPALTEPLPRWKLNIKCFALVGAVLPLALAGCTQVVTTTDYPNTEPVPMRPTAQLAMRTGTQTYYDQNYLSYYAPRAFVHIDITSTGGSPKDDTATPHKPAVQPTDWTVKVTPVYCADTSVSYRLKPKENFLFDDDTVFGIDANGLLSSMKSTSTDETVASLGNLITAAGNALSFGAAEGVSKAILQHPGQTVEATNSYHADINPYLIDNRLLTVTLHSYGIDQTFVFYFNFLGSEGQVVKRVIDKNTGNKHGGFDLDGIVVRLPVPLRISVTNNPDAAGKMGQAYQADYDLSQTSPGNQDYAAKKSAALSADNTAWTFLESGKGISQSMFALVPDIDHTCLFPFDRRYTVQTSRTVTLTNGMITSIEINKPSLVAGIVGIPKTILAALSPIPLQIKQSQTNILQAEDNALKAKSDISQGQ